MASTTERVSLAVNGTPVTVESSATTPLMHVLRDELGLKGVRVGCSIGECGSCTVLVDGAAVKSCLTQVGDVAGTTVTTPEGLGTPDAPHPVQCAFLDEQAAQCGYCINGMIMKVAAEVGRGGCRDVAAAREALDEHICRCGTHSSILRAAVRAAGAPVEDDTLAVVPADDGLTPPMPTELPPLVARERTVGRWLRLAADGSVEVLAGKVEIGQGILEAMRRTVASQLGLPVERVRTVTADTTSVVNLMHTAGSNSTDEGIVPLAWAARALARLVREATGDTPAAADLGELAAGGGLDGDVTLDDRPDWAALGALGPSPRHDLAPKITGAPGFVHDLTLPGMAHVRSLLPPTLAHEPTQVPDLDAFAAAHGLIAVLRDGNLLLVAGSSDIAALRGVNALAREITWKGPEASDPSDVHALLRTLPSEPFVARADDGVDAVLADHEVVRATFTKPYEAHASVSASAAVALTQDGVTTVWSHTQSPFPLRDEIALLLDVAPEQVVLRHADGPGCYGSNGADDAASIAAVASAAMPGVPVRYQHTMDDEFGWDPLGPAMVADVEVAVDASGHVVGWRNRTWTDAHFTRPVGTGDRLLAAWLRADAPPPGWGGPHEGGTRDSIPYYDVGPVDAVANHVRGPIRTGALRSLASYFHVYGVETLMDELAERAGRDPVAFRLEHLTDPRGRRVLELCAERAGWTPRVGPSGRGLGIAFARYKATKGYVATAVEATVDAERGAVRADRVVVVCDAGTVIDPAGLRQQLEGATIQSLSRVLHEEIHLAGGTVRERGLATYPVLRFHEVPRIEVVLVDRPGFPPIGAGESATPTLAPALANAIDDAVGIRLRDLPITPARMEARLLAMDEGEMARVRL